MNPVKLAIKVTLWTQQNSASNVFTSLKTLINAIKFPKPFIMRILVRRTLQTPHPQVYPRPIMNANNNAKLTFAPPVAPASAIIM